MERIEVESDRKRRVRLRIAAPPRSGQTVMTLAAIHKTFGDKEVYTGIDFEIHRGDCVALVGPNGAGKSTLLRILNGSLDFDAGTRTLGHNVKLAFYAQHQLEVLDYALTVLQELQTVARTEDYPRLRGHLGAFLFSGDDVEKPVSVLSGGEKARLALAKMLLHPANFLVLDEPTNHLDIEACEVLEEALAGFAGTMVFVSHDRAFINALATRVVEVRGGVLREFIGNYDDYLRKLGESPAPALVSDAGAAPEASSERRAKMVAPASKQIRAQERQRKKAREQLSRKIAKLEETIAGREQDLEALGWRLGDPEVFKDADQVREINAARDATQSEIAALYRDWERLSGELEALHDALES
jgi:ATP-binding cassette subfamily F protein 3